MFFLKNIQIDIPEKLNIRYKNKPIKPNKMKRIILIANVLIGLLFNLKAQQPLTYIGFEGGAKWDYYQLKDYGDGLLYKAVPGLKFGFTVGHEFLPKMFAETGIYYNQLSQSIRYKVMPFGYSSGNTNLLIDFPLRFKYRYPILKDKLSLTGSVGLIFSFNTNYKDSRLSSGGTVGIATSSDSAFSTIKEYYSDKMIIPQGEIGLSADYKFNNNIILSLLSYYSYGFSKVYTEDITYRINTEPEQNAKIVSKGTNYNVLLSLKLPLSNIWDKTEKGIKNKDELIKAIQSGREKRFYISAETGFYNPYYDEDNIHITGKFEPELFIYSSNFYYGVNFGVKIYKDYIAETGFYKNDYTNRYNVDLDSIGYGTGYSGGDYFSIPVNLKYRFILNKRMSFEPFIGTSILFSKKTGMYDYSSSTGINITNGIETLHSDNSFAYRENNPVITISGGGGIEFAASKNVILMLNASYEQGFKNFNRLNVDFKYGDFEEIGNVFYKGNNFKISAGIKVPVGF